MTAPVQLLTHEYPPFTGGIGNYVRETALALSRAGADVTVWAPAYGQAPATDADEPFRVRRVPMRGSQGWSCRLRLAAALRRAFPGGRIPGGLILAEPGPIRLWLYARWLKLPRPDRLAVILHGSEIQSLSRLPRHRRLLRHLLAHSDGIGLVSRAVRELLEDHLPGLPSRTGVIPGAVRSDWQALAPVPFAARSSAPRTLLQVGRISPRKGQLDLLKAVSLLPAETRCNLRVRLVGPVGKAGYARLVSQLAASLDCEVTLDGLLDSRQLQAAYCQAFCLVMPSRPYRASLEGLGIALLEAAHFGCPVIGTEFGGIPEALQPGSTGLLVPPADPGSMALALQRLLAHSAMAARLGSEGAAFVRRRFSWDRNAAFLLQVLNGDKRN
jgi:glycosyltransferase involved in cell wall biosynthesis